MLDPKTKKVLHKLGSLCLMTQHHEMLMAGIVRDAGGEMTFNGAPRTRTWRTYAQQGGLAGGSRSAYLHEVHNLCVGRPPAPDLPAERALGDVLRAAIAEGLLSTAHDVSDGGLAVCLAECAAKGVGADVRLPPSNERADVELFAENPGRVVVACPPESLERLLAHAQSASVPIRRLGDTGGEALVIEGRLDVPIQALIDAREGGLEGLM